MFGACSETFAAENWKQGIFVTYIIHMRFKCQVIDLTKKTSFDELEYNLKHTGQNRIECQKRNQRNFMKKNGASPTQILKKR